MATMRTGHTLRRQRRSALTLTLTLATSLLCSAAAGAQADAELKQLNPALFPVPDELRGVSDQYLTIDEAVTWYQLLLARPETLP